MVTELHSFAGKTFIMECETEFLTVFSRRMTWMQLSRLIFSSFTSGKYPPAPLEQAKIFLYQKKLPLLEVVFVLYSW